MSDNDQHNDQHNDQSDNYVNDLTKLIEEALASNIINRKEYKDYEKVVSSVEAVVSEYLDSFIILGYDFDGNVVDIHSARSEQQHDALHTLILKHFYNTAGSMSSGYIDEGNNM